MSTQRARWLGYLVTVVLLAVVISTATFFYPVHLEVRSPFSILAAIPLLAIGMLSQFLVWHYSVKSLYPDTSPVATFMSHSLTIWGKYIPGKIWSVVGRAALLGRIAGLPHKKTLLVSTLAQVTMIVSGLVAGLALVQLVDQAARLTWADYGWISLFLLSLIGILLLWLGRWGSKSRFRVTSRRALGLAGFFGLVAWLAWGLGFHQLSLSLGIQTGWLADLGTFALASTAGIMSVFAPGGLGVREGALSALVAAQGISAGEAAVLSLMARVWFIFGELMMFLAALLVKIRMGAGVHKQGTREER